jgi:transposase
MRLVGAVSPSTQNYSPREAAKRLGIGVLWLRRLRRALNIGRKVGREYRYSDTDLDALREKIAEGRERKRAAMRERRVLEMAETEQALRAAGLISASQLSEDLGKQRNYVVMLSGRLDVGQRLGDRVTSPFAFTPADVDTLRDWIARQARPEVRARRTAPMIAASRRRIERNRAAVRADGLVLVSDLAEQLDRHQRTVLHHAVRRGLGQRVAGIGGQGQRALVLEPAEAEIVRQATQATAFRDPETRAAWYEKRFGSTAMYGRLAAQIAAVRGTRPGRPRAMVAELEAQAFQALAANPELKNSALARILGLSISTVRRWRLMIATDEGGFEQIRGDFEQLSI